MMYLTSVGSKGSDKERYVEGRHVDSRAEVVDDVNPAIRRFYIQKNDRVSFETKR